MSKATVLPYTGFVRSQPALFLIGPRKQQRMIHSALVANNIILGKKIKDGAVTMDGKYEDADTFDRAAEFLYTGDYTPAHPLMIPLESDDDDEDTDTGYTRGKHGYHTYSLDSRSATPKSEGAQSDKNVSNTAWDNFKNDKHYDFTSKAGLKMDYTDVACDYTGVLDAHFRLACFAEKYLMFELEELVIHKMHKLLSWYPMHEVHDHSVWISAIVRLIKSCYSLSDKDDGCIAFGVRRLISRYAACHIEAFWKCGEFCRVFKDNCEFPDFKMDLMDGLIAIRL